MKAPLLTTMVMMMMKTNKILRAAMGVALAVVGIHANAAGTAVANLNPTLTINGVCAIAITGNNIFTAVSYGTTAAQSSAASTVTATCPGTPYELTADGGSYYASSSRHLGSASGIAYTLKIAGTKVTGSPYADWGTGTSTKPLGAGAVPTAAASLMVNVAIPGATDTFTVNAEIASISATQAIGTYSDTVIVTASW